MAFDGLVRSDGSLGRQKDDGGGCATMSERQEGVESPSAYVDDRVKPGNFCLALRSFGPPSSALLDYHPEKGGMPLHDAVGVNCKNGSPTENQGTGGWYVG